MVDAEITRNIKSRFFLLRNGVVSDRLRKAGCKNKVIFGLLQPQLQDVSAMVEPSLELAEWLWNDTSTRESRLLATMVCPPEDFDEDIANRWINSTDSVEQIDALCFRLVRNLPHAMSFVSQYLESENELKCYFAFRLAMNLLTINRLEDWQTIYAAAKNQLQRASTAYITAVCRQLTEELDFRQESND